MIVLLAPEALAQTTVDLRTQSRSVDFSAASSTRPMKTGTTLPSVCSAGDMFFKTDAPVGANLYGCAATNTWVVESGGTPGAVSTASNQGSGGVGVFLQKSGTDLQFKNINAASGRVSVANDAANKEIDIDVVPGSLDLGTIGGALSAGQIAAASRQGGGAKVQMAGSGTPAANDCAKFDSSGNIVSAGAPCGSGGGGGGGGSFTAGSGIDNDQLTAGIVAVDTATVPTFLTAATSLDFGPLSQSNCEEQTIAVPGAGTTDSVSPGWPHSLEAGLMGMMFVNAPNVVTVRLCRVISGSVNPAGQNFRATIVRGF
jgi:hypothetical protein